MARIRNGSVQILVGTQLRVQVDIQRRFAQCAERVRASARLTHSADDPEGCRFAREELDRLLKGEHGERAGRHSVAQAVIGDVAEKPWVASQSASIKHLDELAPAVGGYFKSQDATALVASYGPSMANLRIELQGVPRTPPDQMAIQPAWSPSGKTLAYSGMPARGEPTAEEMVSALRQRRIWALSGMVDNERPRTLTDDPSYRDEWPQWSADGQPLPRRLRALVSSRLRPVEVHRLDARSLVLRPEAGFLHGLADPLFRGPDQPLTLGQHIALSGMTVEITELGPDQRPAEAVFRFDVPLEDKSLRWLQWRDGRFEPFIPPPVGQRVTLPGGKFGLRGFRST